MQRKVVTILFCDVVGSTALGEATDPEALRSLLARYFERMAQIVEHYEGTVEKFIGDAVMAVFGIPAAHEDDALRACRAALEMQAAFPNLGVEGRIGVTTGEVVTGTEERLATGDAVNLAARLQQAAQPGEILIDSSTHELLRGAAEAETVEPLELKGKAKPVAAYRLLAVREAERRHDAAFVGRERELAAIEEAWTRALEGRRCELVTIVGEAGVGKSRLVAEALSHLETRVVHGRCLPYGEGITYWPVVEAIKQLGTLPSDTAAAASIRSLMRETEEETSAEEIAWAFRKLLEEAAPLVCLFDDIQWGEETFLDLIEHVALLSTGSPFLVLCMARPDLADRRPSWPVGLRLDPLGGDEVEELIGDRVGDEMRGRIAKAAGGNPLFVSEMLAMAGEADGEVRVPSTLRALLAARIDQLDSVERSVLERGAVEGEVFHRGAVQALSSAEPVTPRLASLVRRNLIHPDAAQVPGEDAFRFRHLLIRDAAYEALPKASRAELHERLAAWLEERGRDLVELDEIVGFHLEHAAVYRAELGQPDQAVAERAAECLVAAARRAFGRDDKRAAAALLERALALTRPLRFDLDLEIALARAQLVPRDEAAIADRAAEQARRAGDRAGEALARVVAAYARALFADKPDVDGLARLAQEALPLLEQNGDDAGLAIVWYVLGNGVANVRGSFGEWARAAERAIHYFRRIGQQSELAGLSGALLFGPQPADEALRALDSVLPPNPQPGVVQARAQLLAMLGRFDEAWAAALTAAERRNELTGDAAGEWELGKLAVLAGDHAAAVAHLRRTCDMYERLDSRALLSTAAPELGRSLCELGRYDEAERFACLGRDLGGAEDRVTQTLWRQVLSLVHASRGEFVEAERLAREAVVIAEQTDGLCWQGDALFDLAEVLAAAGRTDEAVGALGQALERYERKRNLASAGRVRAKLSQLRPSPAPAESA